jgi:malonate-semialdehyde dehydrogenase (acetylating)/methylmalonate-semialdehyde dehydrogenase
MAAGGVLAAMSGCTGQRRRAASVMVAVKGVDHILERMVAQARTMVPGRDIGPVITREAKQKIERYITEAEQAGAKVLVDGRGAVAPGKEGGFYVGPTIIDGVRADENRPGGGIRSGARRGAHARPGRSAGGGNRVPVRQRGVGIHGIRRGGAARHGTGERRHGGVNVGPVPREPFSFGGWNDSKFGVGDITGRGSIEFWTKSKKIPQMESRSRNELDVQIERCHPYVSGHTPSPYARAVKPEERTSPL